MKNVFTIIPYLIIIIFLNSCKKYEVAPTLPTIEGTEWVLQSGRAYVENLDNGDLTYYHHFGSNRTVSNLDIFGGSSSDVDELIRYQTLWYFLDGNFILNNTVYYEYTSMGSGINTQYTLIGIPPFGSARNIGVLELTSTTLTIIVYEANESHNGVNYHYFSTLTFIKNGTSCQNCGTSVFEDYVYEGILDNVIESVTDFEGTTWIITRYDEGMTPYYPNDTLTFLNKVAYTINGGGGHTYSLSNITGNNMHNLTLYDCSTLGGNYSGQLSVYFIDAGEINNMTMNGIFGTSGSVQVWLEKL